MKGEDSNENQHAIKFSSLVIINRLGRGATSHVFKTESIRTKQIYAMKVIDKSEPNYSSYALNHQIDIHRKLRHDHIVRFIEHFEDTQNHYLLNQYCAHGEATKYLFDSSLSEPKLIKMAEQMAMALNYMHKKVKISHGDVKLSNILVSQSKFKLCDFGHSSSLEQKTKQNKNNPIFGTLMYASPQILVEQRNSKHKEADIWALGICLLALMLRKNPYETENQNQLRAKIKAGSYIRPSQKLGNIFSADLISLIESMLERDPERRITAQQILAHSIFSKSSKENMRINQLSKTQNYRQKEDSEKISLQFSSKSKHRANRTSSKSNLKTQSQNQTTMGQKNINQKEEIKFEDNVFNETADTSGAIDLQSSVDEDKVGCERENLNLRPIYCWSLKPQIQKTKDNGYIEIKKDHSIRIKIKNLIFTINSEGSEFQLEKKNAQIKKYTPKSLMSKSIDEKQRSKIICLYDYAFEVVSLMKKKQCQVEFVEDDWYFWMERSSNNPIQKGMSYFGKKIKSNCGFIEFFLANELLKSNEKSIEEKMRVDLRNKKIQLAFF